MTGRRPPAPRVPPRERVVGEDQWVDRRGTTLREFLGAAFVWVSVGTGLFLLFLASANTWLVHQPVVGWSFYGRTVGLVVSLIVVWGVAGRTGSAAWRSGGVPLRVGLAVVMGGLVVGSIFAFKSTVETVPDGPRFAEVGGRFAFGGYPTPELLRELRREGFEGVISILEPGASVREATLHAEEEGLARDAGLRMISTPLFDRGRLVRESLATLRRIVGEEDGRYYVHGLTSGSKRLAQARAVILRLGGRRVLLTSALEEGTPMERGPVYRLGADVHLTPFPTDAEILEYLVGSPVRTVIVLLDPASPEDREWIDHEREALEGLDFEFRAVPFSTEPFDPARAMEVLEMVRSQEPPVVVHTFLTPSVRATALRQSWFSGLPPLPRDVVEGTLSGGAVHTVSGHVAMGPRPVGREFGWLYRRGVRSVAALGPLTATQRRVDRGLSDVAGLEWYFADGDLDGLLERMTGGGPWYVYGEPADSAASRIRERFGEPLEEAGV